MKSLERKVECFHIFRKIGRNIVYGNFTNLLLENNNCSCVLNRISSEFRHWMWTCTLERKIMPLSVLNPLITVENNIYPTGGKDRTGRAEKQFVLSNRSRINPVFVNRLTVQRWLQFHSSQQACRANTFFKILNELFIQGSKTTWCKQKTLSNAIHLKMLLPETSYTSSDS